MSSPVKICVYIIAVVTILTVAMTVFVKTQVTPEKVKKTLLPLIENSLDRNVDFGEVRIGLFTGISVADVTVMQKNEEKVFFSIKSVELHYQLWQLLLGKVVVDQILLDHPEINCVRGPEGQFNFIDLLPTASSVQYDNAKSTDNKAVVMLSESFNFLIKEVSISDGQVLFVDKYKNQRTPFRYTFSNINVKARQIAFDKSIPIDLSAVVNGSNIDISGNYNLSRKSGDLTVHLASLDLLQLTPYYREVLPGKLGSAHLGLNLEVDLQPHMISSKGTISFEDVDLILDKFPNAPLKKAKIGTEYALNYRIDKKLLSLSTLLLNFNDIKLGAEGEIDLSRPDPFLVFTLLLKQFDLREVMQSLPTELSRDYRKYSFAGLVDGRVELSGKMSSGVDLLKSVTLSLSEVRASAENLRAGISGDISYQDQILRSEKLVLQYGDQQAMLQFKAKKSSDNVFRGDFSLSADTLNLNKMLPEQIDEIQVASEDNGGISAPQIQKTLSDDIGPFNLPIDMVGTVVINRLIYKKMNIDRVTANLSLENNYLVVDNLTSQIGDGQLRGASIVNFGVKGLAYRGELGLSQSNVMPLVASLFPRFNQSASGALQFQSRFSGHGTIPVNLLRDLQLKGSFGLQNGEIRGSSLLEALASFLGTSDLKVLSFQSLNGQYELQDGLVQLNGQLDSSKVKLAPSGSIDIAGRLNFKLGASFASEILDKLGINKNLKETISGRDGWGNLPLEIRGTLDNPLFSYDSSALQNQIVEKTSQKLVEKNTPDDVEGKESIRKMLDNTLDKLFRK